MSNPLLTPQQNAELTALRNANAGSVSHWKTETDYTPTLSDNTPIDWQRIHALIPWFAVIGAVVMWAMFLLIPTAFNLHYAGMFPAMSNWSYVAMGLTLCMAAFRAAKSKQGVHAIGFTFAVLLLSYWF